MRRLSTLLVVLVSCLFCFCAAARADDEAAPGPRLFASQSGTFGFKVLPNSFEPARGVLFSLADDGSEQVAWSRQLVNLPDRVFVANDGRRIVTIDTIAARGFDHSLVVYEEAGNPLADYRLEDLLTEKEIRDRVASTKSNRWWAEEASFTFVRDSEFFEVKLPSDKVILIDLESGRLEEIEAGLRRFGDVYRAVRDDPDDEQLRQELLALAKELARHAPGEAIWRTLLEGGALSDGMSLEDAETILGRATDVSEDTVGWYFNPGNRRAAPYLNAEMTPRGLVDWRIDRR